MDETDAWFYDRQVTSSSPSRAAPVKKVAVKSEKVADLTAHLRKLTAGADDPMAV